MVEHSLTIFASEEKAAATTTSTSSHMEKLQHGLEHTVSRAFGSTGGKETREDKTEDAMG